MPPQRAELNEVGVFLEGVARQHVAPQHRQEGLQILREEAAEDHVAVERQMDAVDRDGQMPQHVVEQRLVLGHVRLRAAEELLERDPERLLDPQGRTVGLETALLAAVAAQAAGLDADVAELPAVPSGAAVELAVDQHGAADAVFQRKIGHFLLLAPDEALGVAAGRAVVVHIDRIGDLPGESRDRHVPQPQRRGELDAAAVGAEQRRDRDAHAEQFGAVDPELVQKAFQLPGEIGRLVAQARGGVEGDRLVGQLPQTQVRRHEAQMVLRHRDADRDARVRDDVEALGFAPAGGAVLTRVADQALIHQLVEIQVERGHADAAALREALPGDEVPRLVERAVDAAADRNMPRL